MSVWNLFDSRSNRRPLGSWQSNGIAPLVPSKRDCDQKVAVPNESTDWKVLALVLRWYSNKLATREKGKDSNGWAKVEAVCANVVKIGDGESFLHITGLKCCWNLTVYPMSNLILARQKPTWKEGSLFEIVWHMSTVISFLTAQCIVSCAWHRSTAVVLSTEQP